MSFHSCYLSDYVCSYYLTFPPNMMGYSGSTFFPHLMLGYSYFACPMYAPCVKDGGCRYCGLNARHHRKYFLYSIMASKIQKMFFTILFPYKYHERNLYTYIVHEIIKNRRNATYIFDETISFQSISFETSRPFDAHYSNEFLLGRKLINIFTI